MEPITLDFRPLAEKVLAEAKRRGIESRDWGDAVSLEFSDGYDALHLDARSVDTSVDPGTTIRRLFDRYARLDPRRTQIVWALAWWAHDRGTHLEGSRSGRVWIETRKLSVSAEVGWPLTRRLETLDDPTAFKETLGFYGRSLGPDELREYLEREDLPPQPPQGPPEPLVEPGDDWYKQLQSTSPGIDIVAERPETFRPPPVEDALTRAESRARRLLEAHVQKAKANVRVLATTFDPPWCRLAGDWVDGGWHAEVAMGLLEAMGDDGRFWDLVEIDRIRLASGDETARPAARGRIERWWAQGGHDIQDHLPLLGHFPELETHVEDVLVGAEGIPHAESLLGWHLPTRRALSWELTDWLGDVARYERFEDALARVDDLLEIVLTLGPEGVERLVGPDALEPIRQLLDRAVDDLGSVDWWLSLRQYAPLMALWRWDGLIDRLLERPDLPAILFAVPLACLEQRKSKDELAHHWDFVEPLFALSLAKPGDPRIRNWVALALEFQEQMPMESHERLALALSWFRVGT